MLDVGQWHARYQQQARWTQNLRAYLFPRAGLETARRILEVGCGTGAILQELQRPDLLVAGIDLDRQALAWASQQQPTARLSQGDGHQLPYRDECFDICCCHYLLLWVADPVRLLRAMRRVTRPGGWLLALAEPDYAGRVDYPPELVALGRQQALALQAQGADPQLGRKLRALFQQVGLADIECGVLGGQWTQHTTDWPAWESEWQVIRADLTTADSDYTPLQIDRLQEIDRQAWQQGQRVLYVPTFYAAGRIPP